jgi:hypothetical protein
MFRTRSISMTVVVSAMLTAGTACSIPRENKCGGQEFEASYGGHHEPLGACGDRMGQPVSAPSGFTSADYQPVASTLTVKVGQTLKIGYNIDGPPPQGTFTGVASSSPDVLAVTSGVDNDHLGVFRAVAPGTSQITVDPLAACGSTTIRCLIVTVTVSGS